MKWDHNHSALVVFFSLLNVLAPSHVCSSVRSSVRPTAPCPNDEALRDFPTCHVGSACCDVRCLHRHYLWCCACWNCWPLFPLAPVYVLIHHIIFGFIFTSWIVFFIFIKYSCTKNFHRLSLNISIGTSWRSCDLTVIQMPYHSNEAIDVMLVLGYVEMCLFGD